MGTTTADATEFGAAGLGGLMASMKSAADAGSRQAADMMEAMFGQTAVADAMGQKAKLMLRSMLQAANADGDIAPEEQAAILERLGELSDEERAFVQAELAAEPDLSSFIQDASDVGRE